jgi:peptidoglycan/xylan/chitin deacetylase (PgdA/CDA1 family)
MLTGQLSISRQDYQRIGGFDTGFTRRGLAPGADLDFGHRARNAGLRVVFNPDAISYQYYDVDPAEYLKRAREDGRSAHELLVKHPDQAAKLGNVPGFARRRDRWLLGPFLVAPAAVSWPLRAAVVALARSGHTGKRLRDLFFLFRTLERLRGLRMARRAGSTGKAVVLAYHAIGDRRGDAILRRYSVPPGRFARQLDSLASAGWTFIDASMLLGALSGERRLPRRAALLTFDDGYVDFATAALPELTRRDVPAIVFVVAEQIGGANDWDQQIGGGVAQLMDADALRRIAAKGVEIGSHGLRHRSMAELDSSSLAAEASESAAALESLGLDRPRLFAYPYGHCTPDAEAEIHQAGYRAAFTVSPGVVARGCNLYALPRIQVLRGYMPAILRLKLATARWSPHWLERLFGIVGARG